MPQTTIAHRLLLQREESSLSRPGVGDRDVTKLYLGLETQNKNTGNCYCRGVQFELCVGCVGDSQYVLS